MRKKVVAGLVCVMMIGTMAMQVSAETKDLPVKYAQATTYTLSIPAEIELSVAEAKTLTNIGVSAVNAEPDKEVQVKVKSGITNNHQVELTRSMGKGEKVVSTVTDEKSNTISNGFIVAKFWDQDTTPHSGGTSVSGNGTLSFSIISDSAGGTVKAGSYTGTITFEGAVEANGR